MDGSNLNSSDTRASERDFSDFSASRQASDENHLLPCPRSRLGRLRARRRGQFSDPLQ